MLALRTTRALLGAGPTLRLAPATVVVDGTRIVRVVEGAAPDAPAGAPAPLDLGDKPLLPAFVNAHTHIAMSGYRGVASDTTLSGNVVESLYFAVESHLQPGDVRAFARMGAWECLLAGTGTVWDHYYEGLEVAAALADVGIGGVVAPTLQDLAGPGRDRWAAQLEATARIDEDAGLRERGILAALGPHATDTVSTELWRRAADLAAERALPVHAHVAQSIEEVERSVERHACLPVERLHRHGLLDAAPGTLLVHGLFAARRELALLDPARHVLGHCPYSQVQFGFPAPVRAWRQAGLRVAIGTDCGSCNDTMDVQQELRLAAWGASYGTTWSPELEALLRDGGLDAARAVAEARARHLGTHRQDAAPAALLSAVLDGPGSLHPKDAVGAIAPGARAHLLVLDDGHPLLWPGANLLHTLVTSTVAPAIWGLMLSGAWRGVPGDFARSVRAEPLLAAHRAEADARLASLLRRAGIA